MTTPPRKQNSLQNFSHCERLFIDKENYGIFIGIFCSQQGHSVTSSLGKTRSDNFDAMAESHQSRLTSLFPQNSLPFSQGTTGPCMELSREGTPTTCFYFRKTITALCFNKLTIVSIRVCHLQLLVGVCVLPLPWIHTFVIPQSAVSHFCFSMSNAELVFS